MDYNKHWDLTTIPDAEFYYEVSRRRVAHRKPSEPADQSPKRLEFLARRKEYLRQYRAEKRKEQQKL